jgi:Rv0078B-related antitoxin
MSAPSLPAAGFRTTLDLFETGLELMRQNLRREHPDASEDEIDGRLQDWLHHRPGAEAGDCAGRPVDVNARLG